MDIPRPKVHRHRHYVYTALALAGLAGVRVLLGHLRAAPHAPPLAKVIQNRAWIGERSLQGPPSSGAQ